MKKITTTIALLIAATSSLVAGPLEGTWVNTDAASKHQKVIITTDPEKGTKFTSYYEGDIQIEENIQLIGDSVAEKSPDKYGHLIKDLGWAKRTYFISRKGDNLVIRVVAVFTDKRSGYLNTRVYKPQKK